MIVCPSGKFSKYTLNISLTKCIRNKYKSRNYLTKIEIVQYCCVYPENRIASCSVAMVMQKFNILNKWHKVSSVHTFCSVKKKRDK